MNASPKNDANKLTIGRLALAAGVGLGTVRYYQKRGLLREPARPPYGGFRVYGAGDLERLMQIRSAQELGFTLTEISKLFAYLDQRDCQAVKSVIEGKLKVLSNRIRKLDKARKTVAALADSCRGDCVDECAVEAAIGGMSGGR